MSRIGVAGGTGLTGRHVVDALRRSGHEAVVLSRASGVDLVAGAGLADALRGATAVIDVTNTPAADPDDARAFFGAVTRNLLTVVPDFAQKIPPQRHLRVMPGRAGSS